MSPLTDTVPDPQGPSRPTSPRAAAPDTSRTAVSRRALLGGAAGATAALGAAATLAPAAQATPPREDLPVPEFREVSVHDPSIVAAGDELYIFGSHLAAARTGDLLRWEGVADLVTPQNPLFEDVTTELAEAFDWANTDTLWAADVSATEDGRYRMYYCACEGTSPRSAMGTAVADAVDGPYRDEGIFLRSGMWDETSEDGSVYDARVHPNVIDPHAFVDAEGRHRLVYGSYSGGLFLMDLDPETGRPTPGQGYGIHLMGGNHARIEAPYILHSAQSGYYYLLVTFGGLDAAGGYNIRVGRSRSVEGPYRDPMGQDLQDCAADPDLPLFDDASIEPYALKLMGNHEFLGTHAGAEQDRLGYVSPGHVSAWTRPGTEDSFLIFHSRFPGTGEAHQVRVHRLHISADGWPLVAVHRYAGEPDAGEKATRLRRPDLAGDWQLVDHGRAISPEIVPSQPIVLERSGRITGAVSGTWRIEAGSRAVLDLDGVRFTGTFTPGWNESAAAWTPTLTASADDGRCLGATKVV